VGAHRVVRRRGCHTLIYNQLIDGSEVVSRPPLAPRKIPGTHF
jgi:hypothetical protein